MDFKDDKELNDYIQSKLPEGSSFSPKQKIEEITNFTLLLSTGITKKAVIKKRQL